MHALFYKNQIYITYYKVVSLMSFIFFINLLILISNKKEDFKFYTLSEDLILGNGLNLKEKY